MRKLILIKHASPFVTPGAPPERWKLSDKGRDACVPLADAITAHAPAIVISSDEPKAAETAELVASRLGVPTQTAPDLHEHDRRDVPHMRSGEFISHMELFFRRPGELVLGGETADDCLDRFESAIDQIIADHPDGNLAIVSHGTVIALFIAEHAKQNPFELWRRMGLPSFAVVSLPDFGIETIVEKL